MVRMGVEGGSKCGLEVGLVIRYKIPQQADGVVPSVGFRNARNPSCPAPSEGWQSRRLMYTPRQRTN